MENEAMQNIFPQNTPAGAGKGLSIAALVLGILGIVVIPLLFYFAAVCAILGLVFGVIGRKKTMQASGRPSGLATAGFVLGIIGTSFAALILIYAFAYVGWLMSLAAI